MPINCTRCDKLRPHSEFYSGKLADIKHSVCNDCSLEILKNPVDARLGSTLSVSFRASKDNPKGTQGAKLVVTVAPPKTLGSQKAAPASLSPRPLTTP